MALQFGPPDGRRLASLVAVGTLVAACSGGTTASPTTAPASVEATSAPTAAAPATITWLNLNFWDTKELVAKFQADKPGITVNVESVPFADLANQIQIRLGSSSPTPDLISVDAPLTTAYATRGWLVPIGDQFSPADIADFVPGAVDAGSFNGELVAAPQSTSTQLLYINDDLFSKAGITPPGPDDRWTWEQVADAARKLASGDTYGFTFEQVNQVYQLQPLVASLGGEMIGADGKTVDRIINSQQWVDAMTYYQNIYNSWAVGPKGSQTAADLFNAGKLAMFVGGEWNIRSTPADVPFKWSVSRSPYFANGKIVTPTGAWHIGVSAYSKNIDAAKTFAHWISTGEGAQEWFKIASFNLPAQISVQKTFEGAGYNAAPLSYLRTAGAESQVGPVIRPKTPGYLEYSTILQKTFDDIRNGADIKASLDAAVSQITSEMAKY